MKNATKQLYVIMCVNVDNGHIDTKPLQIDRYTEFPRQNGIIRESVDSLCRDGANMQYMQYLGKSRITSPQTRKKLI